MGEILDFNTPPPPPITGFDDVLARVRHYVPDACWDDFQRDLKKALGEFARHIRQNWPQLVREQSRFRLSKGTVEFGPYMTVMNHWVRVWDKLTA